ncbi:hypothetical protein KEM48_008253 [Puccinia striiformis f. sp. tritici PST-130]|nr:hypothetical protein KEM48_008253 [Puccinia striiformis f. sp. tritici PST-130]
MRETTFLLAECGKCWNSVASFNSLKRNKDSLSNLKAQKNKRVNSHHTQLIRDENLIDRRSIDDLVGPSVIVLDHQPSHTIVDSQQLSSHQQEQTLPQSSKQLESSLLTRITLPTKENSHHIT